MNAAEVDLDQLVDYKTEYASVIKKHQITGDQMIGLCPFHPDRNNSFSVDLKTGRWHCFSEDRGGNFVSFYAELHGIDTKEAYKEILQRYGVAQEPKGAKPKAQAGKGYTLSQYAFEKRLPEDWLKGACKLETCRDRDGVNYMKIPYLNEDGKEVTYRKRYANKDFRWKYGSSGKIGLYGEWRLRDIRAAGYAALVEGESDSQSMWQMGISTLGVPGASMFKPHQADMLQDLRIYIHQEPDQGGETFLRKVVTGLREGGFIGEVYRWSCSTIHCKDPSEVYIKFGKDQGGKKILALIKKAEKIDLDEPEPIPEAIKGAPVALRQPEGWIYSEKGISHIDEKTYSPKLVCRTPIILTQRLRSIETGEEKMEIAFKRDGEWKKAIFPRSTIFTARSITVLSDLGCTITSENAKQVVRFLADLEAENIDVIRKADSTSTFGWQPGHRFIPGKEEGIVLDIDPSQRSMAAAYCTTGTLAGWIRTMEPHRERDKFRFILAASFAAPLLRIIRQRIFFVYNWGGSKGGKTAALKAALSAWGDPERLMVNFNATQVGLERTASFYCDLPLGIDERQLAGRNQEGLEKTIYMIASGTGKIRGSKGGGLQATHQWRTVALATGEEPLSTETSQTGVSTRVLEIYGGPFDDERSASLMHQESGENCGWAGPEFVEHLIDLDEASVCEKYDEMVAYVGSISQGKSGSHIAGIAAVALADAMVDTWLFRNGGKHEKEASAGKSDIQGGGGSDDPRERSKEETEGAENPEGGKAGSSKLQIDPSSWDRAKQMAAAILQEQMSAEAGDVNENAVQFIVDWILSNKAYFGDKAIGTCLGTLSESGNTAYIFPSMLNQALSKAGYSPKKTMKYMADRGLITTRSRSKDEKGSVNTVVRKFNNRSCRFVEFHIGSLAESSDPLEYDDDQDVADDEGFMPVDGQERLPFD